MCSLRNTKRASNIDLIEEHINNSSVTTRARVYQNVLVERYNVSNFVIAIVSLS